MIGVSQIKDDTGVRLSTTTVRELLAEVDSPVEVQATIIIDINVQRLEVSRGIDDADLAGLNKVIGDYQMLLVRSDLDVVGTHGGLVLVGIIQALDVVQVGDVQGGDVVGGCEGQVEETTVLTDVGTDERGGVSICSMYKIRMGEVLDSDSVTGLGTKIVELLNNTLLAVGILAKGVDDPDLAEVDGSSESGSFRVIGNELDVLDTTTLFQC